MREPDGARWMGVQDWTCGMSRIEELRQRADELEKRARGYYDEASAISERFEHGQPIILNHHSTRSAQRDRTRADDRMRHGAALQDEADELRDRARRLHAQEERKRHFATADVYSRSDIEPGDIVWTLVGQRRIPHRVVRVNAKTVSVETGFSWTDRIAYDEIIDVTRSEASA